MAAAFLAKAKSARHGMSLTGADASTGKCWPRMDAFKTAPMPKIIFITRPTGLHPPTAKYR